MADDIQHDDLDRALRRCGSSWDAAQSHGLLASRLAVAGTDGGLGWLQQVLADTDPSNALAVECRELLGTLLESTHLALSERQSGFAPLLPGDDENPAKRATALAHWCEGFLHGLVSEKQNEQLKVRLAEEPIADIIKDMLQITRATVDEDDDAEESEAAYSELVEYVRVAVQLLYEELAVLRDAASDAPTSIH
jgi:yecA family protein